jgi:hypothetical protein
MMIVFRILAAKVSTILLLLALVACGDTTVKPPTAVDFNTHPSVLRGSWSGLVKDYPATGQTTKLTLTNLLPTCKEILENNRCYYYTVTGNIQLGDGDLTNLNGEGFAGRGKIYALTSPVPDTGFNIDFDYLGESWSLQGDYLPSGASDPIHPAFEGDLWSITSGYSKSFSFQLNTHSLKLQ